MHEVSILAGILTYNRANLLNRCIEKIKSSSVLPTEIVVCDNGSTDGTKKICRIQKVTYVKQGNVGAAKGWNRLINEFLRSKHDYLWLMDDDGFPSSDQLEILLKSAKQENLGIASAVQLDELGTGTLVFSLPTKSWFRSKPKYYDQLKESVKDVDCSFCNLFNGALISKSSVKVVGNIDTSYEMYGEEIDFLYRTRALFSTKTIIKAIHYHPLLENRPHSWRKIFLYYRNSLYLAHRYRSRWFILLMLYYTIVAIKFMVIKIAKI